MLCTEWHPSCEPPLGHVGAHQSDDCVAISGCGELMNLSELHELRKRTTFVVGGSMWGAIGREAAAFLCFRDKP